MTSPRRAVVTSKSHQAAAIGSWAAAAACKGKPGFLEWELPATDQVCDSCPVSRDCHKAGLTPRQIGAMP